MKSARIPILFQDMAWIRCWKISSGIFFLPELERREKRTSLGSGVIIDGSRGLVLTNTHVVEKATTIQCGVE
jgi:S1-C subfamily serine protease